MKNTLLISFLLMLLGCQQSTIDPTQVYDGNLLFSKNPNGHNEIYLLENGIESQILSDPDFDYWWAKVHPDKSKFLVYRSPVNPSKNHDAYDKADLLLVDIDGTNQEVLITLEGSGFNAQGVCRWSPDGSRILMCAEIVTSAGLQWRLISANADGTEHEVLSNFWAIDCNISRDGSEIVFIGFRENDLAVDLTKLELLRGTYDMSANTLSDIEAVTENSSRDHDPAYSPDNRHIVFSAGNALYTNVDLKLFDRETGLESTLLDDSHANGGSMCWSPDGTKVIFHSLDLFAAPFVIKTIDIESGETVTILRDEDQKHGYFHPEAY